MSFECKQNMMVHIFQHSALTAIINHHPFSVPPGLHILLISPENTHLQMQAQVMRIKQQNRKKRQLNSAGDGGCCLPTTEMVSISLPFYEAAARSFCSAGHAVWDVKGTRYRCWDRSLETGNIVAHTVVGREVRKENATK